MSMHGTLNDGEIRPIWKPVIALTAAVVGFLAIKEAPNAYRHYVPRCEMVGEAAVSKTIAHTVREATTLDNEPVGYTDAAIHKTANEHEGRFVQNGEVIDIYACNISKEEQQQLEERLEQ
jgi:hypothetical protein